MVATDHMDASKAFVENVVDLSSHVLVTVSGNIPNAGSFLRNLQMQYRDYEAAQGKKSVDEASQWVANQMSSRCEEDLSVQLLIAGWDIKNGPSLYCVDGEGNRKQGVIGATGSGSDMVYCYGEDGLFYDMCRDDAVKYAREVINYAASGLTYFRRLGEDCEIGGFLSGFYVGATGWEKAFHNVPVEILPQDILEEVVF